jgi:hypothetical protein
MHCDLSTAQFGSCHMNKPKPSLRERIQNWTWPLEITADFIAIITFIPTIIAIVGTLNAKQQSPPLQGNSATTSSPTVVGSISIGDAVWITGVLTVLCVVSIVYAAYLKSKSTRYRGLVWIIACFACGVLASLYLRLWLGEYWWLCILSICIVTIGFLFQATIKPQVANSSSVQPNDNVKAAFSSDSSLSAAPAKKPAQLPTIKAIQQTGKAVKSSEIGSFNRVSAQKITRGQPMTTNDVAPGLNSLVKLCALCGGKGKYQLNKVCVACGGQGSVLVHPQAKKCALCNGRGTNNPLTREPCSACGGSGWAHVVK